MSISLEKIKRKKKLRMANQLTRNKRNSFIPIHLRWEKMLFFNPGNGNFAFLLLLLVLLGASEKYNEKRHNN